jgi:trigger factor
VEVTVEDLSPIKKKLGIALPPEEVQAKIDAAYRGLSQRARIKGFRPGKVPRHVSSATTAARSRARSSAS